MNRAPVNPPRGTRVLTVTAEVRTDPRPGDDVVAEHLAHGWKVYSSGSQEFVLVHPDRVGVQVRLSDAPKE